jgi:hypothetical protein
MGEGRQPDIVRGIRAKIAAGRLPLPAAQPRKLWVGKGTGRPCDGCDRPITDAEVEYELDITTGQTIRFHKPCLDVWHAERAPAA